MAILDVFAADAPYAGFPNVVHIHPNIIELIPTMQADLKPPQ